MSKQNPNSLTELLDGLLEGSEGQEVSMNEMLSIFDSRTYGPLLLAPAIIAVSPLGGIPGMSIVTGSIIFIIALQMLISQCRPWIPKRLLQFSFPHDKMTYSIQKIKPWVAWCEKATTARLSFLTDFPVSKIIAVLCMIHAGLMFPLALVPFAVALPGTAIIFFSLGMISKDGILIIIGFLFTIATWYVSYTML